MGYHRAGFEVVGVDLAPQPRYPFEFHQGDALEYLAAHGHEFDVIHASPPCQAHTAMRHVAKNTRRKEADPTHVDRLSDTRAALRALGLPYVIENVPGAPVEACIMLCGTMFGLHEPGGAELQRHRYFETNWFSGFTPQCMHLRRTISVVGDHARDPGMERRKYRPATITVTGNTAQANVVHNQIRETFTVAEAQEAMGIPWMVMKELSQAIPPAYTEWIGRLLMESLGE